MALTGVRTKTVKTYSISQSFGTETRELEYSTVVRYNNNNQILDSTLYVHNIPLKKKYAYVSGPRSGTRLIRTHKRQLLMQFKYEYDLSWQLVSKALYTEEDSLKCKEFNKFDELMRIRKKIRFDPSKAINIEKSYSVKNSNHLTWGEIFSYDSTGSILEHKELYDGFVIEITTYRIDSTGFHNKEQEYFDPSLMFRTTYTYNDSGSLNEEISVERFGRAHESKNYEYDLYGRNIKVNTFQSEGILTETLNRIYHDTKSRITEIQADSSKKLISRTETYLNQYQQPIIEEYFDNKSRLTQRRNISYDAKGWLIQIHNYDMLRPGKDDETIPISEITYEYE